MLLTTCKNCNKRFKISQSQLEVAKGFVRCGKCYAVFQAKDNLERIDEENQQQSLTDDKLNTKLPPRNPSRTLFEKGQARHFNSFKEAEDLIEAEKKSIEDDTELPEDDKQSIENNEELIEEAVILPEKKSFLSKLFGGFQKEKKKGEPVATEQQIANNIDKTIIDDDQTIQTVAKVDIDFKDTQEANLAAEDVKLSFTENLEENIKVEEKSAEEVAQVIEQITAQVAEPPNNILPVSVNEQGAQIPQQYYPPNYEHEKVQRSELNWTIASIVALIVLIMQLFYLVLTLL